MGRVRNALRRMLDMPVPPPPPQAANQAPAADAFERHRRPKAAKKTPLQRAQHPGALRRGMNAVAPARDKLKEEVLLRLEQLNIPQLLTMQEAFAGDDLQQILGDSRMRYADMPREMDSLKEVCSVIVAKRIGNPEILRKAVDCLRVFCGMGPHATMMATVNGRLRRVHANSVAYVRREMASPLSDAQRENAKTLSHALKGARDVLNDPFWREYCEELP